MRMIKMRIKRTNENGATHYTYPPQYVAEKINSGFGPIYEGGECASDSWARNADDEYILIGVADADADGFLQADGHKDASGFVYEAKEVTKEKSIEDCDKWIKVTEKINDQNKVTSILVKVARGEVLTQADKDALEPTKKDVPGIVNTDSMRELLDKNTITPGINAIKATSEII